MMSSDWQTEQTGVDRDARRLTISAGSCRLAICPGSWLRLNGLRSAVCFISLAPPQTESLAPHEDNLAIRRASPCFAHLWIELRRNVALGTRSNTTALSVLIESEPGSIL